MSKPGFGSNRDISDAFADFLSGVAKFLMIAGLAGAVISIGLLVFYVSQFSGNAPPGSSGQALSFIDIAQKVLWVSVIAIGVGSGYAAWGEELLAPLQLLGAAALWFAPLYLPMAFGSGSSPVAGQGLGALQSGGTFLGIIGFLLLIADVSTRFKMRSQQGFKADQLKYGKGIKEEGEKQNVFMGKCWQLPYCRKFVRERCPIYHAKRTCWKERVGCMCEEQVIRNAMENRPIPKDMVAAANYIPVNNKLTLGQKAERCRQCVIYNEHQKHKYRLAMPATVLSLAAIMLLLHAPLLSLIGDVIGRLDKVIGNVTLGKVTGVQGSAGGAWEPIEWLLLVCGFVVALAYAMKVLEYLIFKLKV